MEVVKIWLVEDDPFIRESLAILLNGYSSFHCNQQFDNAENYFAHLSSDQPQVVLMDITLPGMNGIEAVKRTRAKYSAIEIIMLSIHQEDHLVFASLCAGASGYLIKDAKPAKIIDSIKEVLDGGAPMSTKIARRVIESFRSKQTAPLSDREIEVLELLCRGKSYKMIADDLFVSHDTIRTHIKNIYRKLNVNSSSEAITQAFRNRWITP